MTMLNPEIQQLVQNLAHQAVVDGQTLELRARIDDAGKDARVVFMGGRYGEHGIWLSVSNAARIRAHWEGYCEAQAQIPQAFQPIQVQLAGRYWYCIFSSQNGHEVGIRAWSYVGREEAIAIARGYLAASWENAALVSCEPM